jgi:hypothetical protein
MAGGGKGKGVSHEESPLLEVCKKAYRKHVMQDEGVGWEELSEDLAGVLASVMGDEKFVEWLDSVGKDKPIV